MTIVYDANGDEVAMIDMGRQRPIQPEQSFTLAGRDLTCIVCFVTADTGSDFCTPCRDRMKGTA